ncbi:MAG: DegT/DnrJ/EryC1/StrS family aminotransferase [Mariniblastus sp.]|nr:DegT/DnrJ/EryC1/StrS family aminotransferase [Mariniblastus sp.]
MISPEKNQTESIQSVPLLDFHRGNGPLKAEIMETISSIIDTGRFVGGPFCQQLEEMVAEECQTEFAIGCASGSDALLLALMAVGIEPGDEVICPSFTFFATASAIHRLGAKPVFVDIDPVTFNLAPDRIPSLITDRTKAIIPVHLFGQCCDMDPIMEIARENNLHVIEDAAQSIGASYRGKRAGGIGSIGCFSFYPTKNLGGFGDGGMLTTNDPELADRLRLLANHGMRPRYFHQVVGINSRLDSIQAAVLGIKMRHLSRWLAMRSENARQYDKLMVEHGLSSLVKAPCQSKDGVHVWNQYTIRLPAGSRDQVRESLAERNVGSEIYYPVPLHQQACFDYLNVNPETMVQTDLAAEEVLALPIFPELTREEQRYAVDCLAEIVLSEHTQMRMAS